MSTRRAAKLVRRARRKANGKQKHPFEKKLHPAEEKALWAGVDPSNEEDPDEDPDTTLARMLAEGARERQLREQTEERNGF